MIALRNLFNNRILITDNFNPRNVYHLCVWKFTHVANYNLNTLTFKCNRSLHLNRNFSQTHEDIELYEKPLTKILKIAIIGTPNAGKSTFINQIVGRRVFAISSKVHTTRSKARAVVNIDDTQVVFLDTPGLVTRTETHKFNLDHTFVADGETALTECNVVAVIHDVSNIYTRGKLDPKVLRLLNLYPNKHSVLILNKIDKMKKKRHLLELADRLTQKKLAEPETKQDKKKLSEIEVLAEIKDQTGWPNFCQVFMVSSLEGSGVYDVMEYMLQYAKPGQWMFPDSVYTDQKPEKIICNTVKARLLDHLPHEIPYRCEVNLELFHKLSDGTITTVVLITCPNTRAEKMTIKHIRDIAQETEAELRNAFMTQVLVKLAVQSAEK